MSESQAKKKIRVGIIGASPSSGWALQAHLPALQTLPDYVLTAVATTRQQSADQTARRFGVAHAFDRAQALIEHPEVDLVVVSVRAPDHAPLVRAALAELVRTGKLNFHGTLYGGTLMRWVETSASLSARAYLRGSIARLVGLHGLSFLRPVRPNVFLHVHSIVAHTGGSQVSVLVRVESEDPLTGTTEPVLRGYLTFAPVDGSPVPRLLIATNEARAAFEEVDRLLALQRSVAVEVGGL